MCVNFVLASCSCVVFGVSVYSLALHILARADTGTDAQIPTCRHTTHTQFTKWDNAAALNGAVNFRVTLCKKHHHHTSTHHAHVLHFEMLSSLRSSSTSSTRGTHTRRPLYTHTNTHKHTHKLWCGDTKLGVLLPHTALGTQVYTYVFPADTVWRLSRFVWPCAEPKYIRMRGMLGTQTKKSSPRTTDATFKKTRTRT